MTLEQLELKRIQKKNSYKNKLVMWWNFGLLPIFLIVQLGLAYFNTDIELPLSLIISGTIGLNGLYFGVNYLSKKLHENKQEDDYTPE